MAKFQLSKNFSLNEMCRSNTARVRGLPNVPNAEQVNNLQQLCKNVLQPLRDHLGEPVVINSGFRSQAVNMAVGGAKNSQHLYGQAADIRTVSDHPDDNMALLRCIIESKVPFDKLIAEFVDDKGRPDWIHISFSEKRRGMMLTCRKAKYTSGIKAGQRM